MTWAKSQGERVDRNLRQHKVEIQTEGASDPSKFANKINNKERTCTFDRKLLTNRIFIWTQFSLQFGWPFDPQLENIMADISKGDLRGKLAFDGGKIHRRHSIGYIHSLHK